MASALEKIVESKKLPVLFIGSGISKRYMYHYPNWENLLINSFKYIQSDGMLFEKYKDRLSRQDLTTFEIYAKLGTYAEDDFNEAYFDGKIKLKTGKYPQWLKDGVSPYKIYISQIFKKKKLYEDHYRSLELQSFRALKNKVSAVITTNYDTFIEDYVFDSDYQVFVRQSDLFSSDSYNIAEIYKIHGCVNDASSIVITERDYNLFNQSRKLIIAKMLILFAESPIIFLGYSLTDENIRNIITDFLNCLSQEQLKNIHEHFIFVSYEHGTHYLSESTSKIITTSGATIPITEIKTDNFKSIFDTLNKITPGISPSKIRETRRVVKKIVDKSINSPESESIIVGLDQLDDMDFSNKPLAIAVGYRENILNTYGYGLLSTEYIFEDLLFDNKNFNAVDMCSERLRIPINHLVPVFKYVTAALKDGFSIDDNPQLLAYIEQHNSIDKIIANNIVKSLKNVINTKDITVLRESISNADSINKKSGILLKNISDFSIDEIREILKELFLLNTNEAMKSTNFKRCVMCLDLFENNKESL